MGREGGSGKRERERGSVAEVHNGGMLGVSSRLGIWESGAEGLVGRGEGERRRQRQRRQLQIGGDDWQGEGERWLVKREREGMRARVATERDGGCGRDWEGCRRQERKGRQGKGRRKGRRGEKGKEKGAGEREERGGGESGDGWDWKATGNEREKKGRRLEWVERAGWGRKREEGKAAGGKEGKKER